MVAEMPSAGADLVTMHVLDASTLHRGSVLQKISLPITIAVLKDAVSGSSGLTCK